MQPQRGQLLLTHLCVYILYVFQFSCKTIHENSNMIKIYEIIVPTLKCKK